jgi:uncharacterized membrane protein
MKKFRKNILLFISILSFVGISISYFYLPDIIPIHWNYKMEIDGWANKKYIFIIGLLPCIMIVLFKFLPRFDPRRENYQKHQKAYDMLKMATVSLFIVIGWITVATAMGININLEFVLPAVIGFMFIIIGNYMPTLKSNYYFGIKNPWTLSDDVVWRKTHKLGGYVFAVIGLCMLIRAFIHITFMNYITIIVMIGGIIGVYIYSYILYRYIKK